MIENELLKNIKIEYDINKFKYDKMQDYYDGKTDAMIGYQMISERSNQQAPCNYIQKFINEEASYCVGNPVTYTSNSNNKSVIEDIRINLAHWSKKADKELCKQALIFNQAYELYYTNADGKFSALICNPQNAYVLQDDFGVIQLFIRFFRKKFDNVTLYADVYDDASITHYKANGTFVQFGEVEPNIFSKIPVSIVNIGSISESLFNNLKGLQDSYETVLSNIVNETSDNRNAILTLSGCSLEEKDLTDMKKLGIMQFPNKEASANYLIKNLNDSFIQNTLSTLQENMYMLANHINHNEAISSNTSSLAQKNRLLGLINKCTNNTQALQDCIKTRLIFLFEYLQIKTAKAYLYTDIEIKLTANIPSDDLLMAQVLSQYPKISAKTGLSQFSFISNVENEMKQKDLEDKASSIGEDLLNKAV